MTEPTKTDIARPMPRPTAQVAMYVEALGPETAMLFLLRFGGAELHSPEDPRSDSNRPIRTAIHTAAA